MSSRNTDRVLRRFGGVLVRFPRYALLATNLARDSRLTSGQKARAAACLGYALSPIDLLPGIIPVVGQLDDLTVLVGGLRGVVNSCPPEVAREQLQRSGLTLATMEEDLETIKATAWWLARGAFRWVGRGLGASVRLALQARRLV